jgi:hypothetical protein
MTIPATGQSAIGSARKSDHNTHDRLFEKNPGDKSSISLNNIIATN